jgi:hypothetical protein
LQKTGIFSKMRLKKKPKKERKDQKRLKIYAIHQNVIPEF